VIHRPINQPLRTPFDGAISQSDQIAISQRARQYPGRAKGSEGHVFYMGHLYRKRYR